MSGKSKAPKANEVTIEARTTQALQAAEARYQSIFENAVEGIFQSTPGGRYLSVNPAMARLYGYASPEEMLAAVTDISKQLYTDPKTRREFVRRLKKEGRVEKFEARRLRQDGAIIWTSTNARSVRDAKGKVLYFEGFIQDITESKRAEEALQLSEEKHRTLFETMIQGVVYQAANGKIISANPAAERILGLTLDQMQGRTSTDPRWKAIHEDGSDFPGDTHPSMVALVTGKDVHDVVMGIFNPELKDYRWINIYAVPQFRQGDTVPHQVHTTFEDITERKRAYQALRDSEARFRDLFEQAPVGYQSLDGAGYLIEVNQVWLDMLGYSYEEVIGQWFGDFLVPAHVEPFKERFPRFKATGEIYGVELEMLRKDGSRLSISLDGKIGYDERGEFKQTHCILHNVTERKRAEEALRESEAKLRAIFEILPIGVSVLDAERKISYANPALGRILGISIEALFRGDYKRRTFLRPDGTPMPAEEFASVRAFEEQRAVYDVVTCVVKEDGNVIWTSVNAAPVAFPDWKVVVVTSDITERKRAEEVLHRSLEETAHAHLTMLALSQASQFIQKARTPEQVYQAVASQIAGLGFQSVIMILSADRAHLVVSSLSYSPTVTQAAEHLTGLLAQGYRFPLSPSGFYQRLLAKRESVFCDPGSSPVAEALSDPARPLAGRLAALLGVTQAIYAPLIVAGEAFGLLAVIGKGLTQADMPAVTVFANQASTALENAILNAQVLASRERLQLLSRQLLDAQEAERRSLALELHDRLGQDLTALKLQLQSIKQMQDWPTIKQSLDQGVASLEESLRRVRDLSFDLWPAVLDDLGLAAALRWYFDRQAQAAGIGVDFDLQALAARPSEEIEIACFRVAQEALTNILRHANARQVSVALSQEEDSLKLAIRDDGLGFDPALAFEQALSGQSMGLLGMRERVTLTGGTLTVDSSVGRGTTLEARFPLTLMRSVERRASRRGAK